MLDAIAVEGILNKYFSHSEHTIALRLHCNNYNRQHNDAWPECYLRFSQHILNRHICFKHVSSITYSYTTCNMYIHLSPICRQSIAHDHNINNQNLRWWLCPFWRLHGPTWGWQRWSLPLEQWDEAWGDPLAWCNTASCGSTGAIFDPSRSSVLTLTCL